MMNGENVDLCPKEVKPQGERLRKHDLGGVAGGVDAVGLLLTEWERRSTIQVVVVEYVIKAPSQVQVWVRKFLMFVVVKNRGCFVRRVLAA